MNNISVIGRLTRDANISVTSSGIKRAKFTLAIPFYNGKEESVDYIPVIAWRSDAEVIEKYTSKGIKIAIIGKMTYNTYTNKSGKKESILYLDPSKIELIDFKDKMTTGESASTTKKMEEIGIEELTGQTSKLTTNETISKDTQSTIDDFDWDFDI